MGSTMSEGEFHAFVPPGEGRDDGTWVRLSPHPGVSRWAPGSFVLRGTARAYFTSGYDRQAGTLHSDLWSIDLSPLFTTVDPAHQESQPPTEPGAVGVPVVPTVSPRPRPKEGDSEIAIIPGGGVFPTSNEQGVCLTEEDCVRASRTLGINMVKTGDFPTSGCFRRNDEAYFSPGPASQMYVSELPGVQQRIWCTYDETADPPSGSASAACLTREACDKQRQGMGLESFASGSYPTKGCFRKNGKAFFSPGMPQEMSELDLPGLQERIWCGGTESSARRIALGSATFLVILAATMLA